MQENYFKQNPDNLVEKDSVDEIFQLIENLSEMYMFRGVADFSFHSNEVYFESGFALGQGKKVIYTYSKEEFGNAHFDIRPLQHIIYESPEQLSKELVNKIEAFIN